MNSLWECVEQKSYNDNERFLGMIQLKEIKKFTILWMMIWMMIWEIKIDINEIIWMWKYSNEIYKYWTKLHSKYDQNWELSKRNSSWHFEEKE